MRPLIDVLMLRDNLSHEEAQEQINTAKQDLTNLIDAGEMPFDFCETQFGLEEDYLDELLD